VKVAQLIQTMAMGGAEHLAVQIANAQAAAGNESYLYIIEGPGPLSAKISPDVRVKYFEYQRPSLRSPFKFLKSAINGYSLFTSQIKSDGIELMQTHLPGSNFWGLIFAITNKCAVVSTVHNNCEFGYGGSVSQTRIKLRKNAYRQMFKKCDAVVAVSDLVAESLTAELGIKHSDKLVSVPNGVPIYPPFKIDEKNAVRDKYDIGHDELLLLAAGRHCEQKNFRTLIESMGILSNRIKCQLIIAGDGPLRRTHQQHAGRLGVADKVLFPGNVNDLPDLMRASDLYVMSSLWEGLPLVLLEAMACGMANVGTSIEGIEEVIVDGKSGLVVESDNPKVLADAIEELLSSDQKRKEFGAVALGIVKQKYSFERVNKDLTELYEKIVKAQ
jgi:glycosyltransferase involved in cell wall biosynthesis